MQFNIFINSFIPFHIGMMCCIGETNGYQYNDEPLQKFVFRDGRLHTVTPTKNISYMLDNLLWRYDKTLRPSLGGAPTVVEIDINVKSMGEISETDMTYAMDCYFRQSWLDTRLAFSNNGESFTLSVSMLEKLWVPDTIFYNGKKSHLHLITTPNKFIRLHHTGRILYSSRLTVHATCPMNLMDYPMDTQDCPLKIGSFAYSTKDVIYKWNGKRQVVFASDMKLSQFNVISAPSWFMNTSRNTNDYSTLCASFYLQRRMGNFFIQVYGPCMLLVVLSWVSFWLNREATADRVSLGVMTVLTMTFLGLEARADLPRVGYATALDIFVWISFVFIFATIIEYAFVHYFTKYGYGEEYFSETSEDETTETYVDFNKDITDNIQEQIKSSSPSLSPPPPVRYNAFKWLKSEENCYKCQCCCCHMKPRDRVSPEQYKRVNFVPIHPNSYRIERIENLPDVQDCHICRVQNDVPNLYCEGPMSSNYATCTDPHCRQNIAESRESVRNGYSYAEMKQKQHIGSKISLFYAIKEKRKQFKLLARYDRKKSSTTSEVLKKEKLKAKSKVSSRPIRSSRRKFNSVSKIDKISRYIFPISYSLINFIYWYIYLSHSYQAHP